MKYTELNLINPNEKKWYVTIDGVAYILTYCASIFRVNEDGNSCEKTITLYNDDKRFDWYSIKRGTKSTQKWSYERNVFKNGNTTSISVCLKSLYNEEYVNMVVVNGDIVKFTCSIDIMAMSTIDFILSEIEDTSLLGVIKSHIESSKMYSGRYTYDNSNTISKKLISFVEECAKKIKNT